MITPRVLTLTAILLMGLMPCAATALDAPQSLRLLGHSRLESPDVTLEEADWRWLRERRTLVMGVSAPDYAPFDLTNNNAELEGITADYAALVGQALGVAIEVRCYDTRDEVIEALKRGDVEFVGSANGYEAADAQLVLSRSYANDQPVLVTRAGDSQALSADLADKRLAMLYHYMQPDAVQTFYPRAQLQLFASTFEAIGAVAFGQADVYLGDAISTRYLINKNHLNNVRMADFSALEANPFGFAFVRDNTRLLAIINAALAAVPVNQQMEILRRWSAGGGFLEADRLRLSESEQRWLEKNPRVKVAVLDQYVPLSFFDEHGHFEGLSAEVLSRISLRTGLKFDVEPGSSLPRQIAEVGDGQVDMLAVVTPSVERSATIRFTRPYLSNPYVLVVRAADEHLVTLEDLPGKRLAFIGGNSLGAQIARDFPGVEFVNTDNPEQAMEAVARGNADATVISLISARYMIARHYRDNLRITSTVGTDPARITFGVNRSQLELYSILDKALLSIAPEEMDELTNHWRSDIILEDSYWLRHRNVIIQGFGLAALLLLVTLGWVAYLRSLIRKRAQAERALSDQMRFMSVLIDGTPHPIYVRDRQGRLMACNNAYLDVFGFKLDNVIGKTVVETDTGNPPQAQSFHADYLRLMEQGEPQIHDRVLKVPSGEVLTIYQWMLPYRDGDEKVVGMIAGWVDVSERQRLLGQLREAKEDADAANRAKTTFLATMSHEIRTPMNAVIGMIELALKNAEQGRADRDALEVASVASRGMLELIGDILDIARIESGHLSLSLAPANLHELLTSVARVFEGLARDKGLSLRVELDPLIDHWVLIDPLRFKQVVSNLLGNAIKFTARGQVRLGAQGAPALAGGHLNLRLWVEDTGPGISAEDQKRLFNPFSQGRNPEQSQRSGSGLGLVISRNLCEMMGGQLHLNSVPGQGTRVDVTLALALTTTAPVRLPEVVQPAPATRTLNILVVDDYPANRLLLARQLAFLGHRITTAEDGVQALEQWQVGGFDGVITDCNMPLKDGYALARAIRARERELGWAPCLLLGFTANAQSEEAERCRQAGMDGCLFKPTGLEDLRTALASRTASVCEPAAQAIFDLSTLVALTGDDRAALKELLEPLLDSLAADSELLPALAQQADFARLHDLAHRAKGGARMVKAHTLIACCEALEEVCESSVPDALDEAVEAVSQAIDHLQHSLTLYINQA